MNLIWKRSNAKVMYQNYTLNALPDVAVLGKRTEVRGSSRGGGGVARNSTPITEILFLMLSEDNYQPKDVHVCTLPFPTR